MPEATPPEPAWVQRMRAAGYPIRIGTGDVPLREKPGAVVHPLPRCLSATP